MAFSQPKPQNSTCQYQFFLEKFDDLEQLSSIKDMVTVKFRHFLREGMKIEKDSMSEHW